MKLVFIHGAPATGKLTVAKALLAAVPGRLFDNHIAIDVARTVFDFGAPGFWELVQEIRVTALRAAAQHHVPLVALTFCYSAPDDLPTVAQFEAVAHRDGGQFLPVFLHCAEDEILRRVGNADRIARRKVSSVEGLKRFRQTYNDAPVPRDNCLQLDTTTQTPDTVAHEIIRRFGLATG
jgi:chloramphenicol 3-O-phosphotransferase